jgi:alkanesulfonate monooxygenase SsuD/methylene tetrahydromethanopterin reductase-like flavin-dependent oxidoreductase (luciferase family)
MKFGSFIFPVSHNPENDSAVIDNTLAEIELQESLGFEATFLTEHHFDGASAYVDPLVFGAAIAVRTKNIKIGFAVVEMAFHHPVRLAAQAALLDNLSHGRLIFGVGRGSAFNTYEYLGFDIPMEEAEARLAEAEELIVKSWTTNDLVFEGKFWNVKFPALRPQPYQKPHPPIVRACISEGSTIAMARIGRPILIGVQTAEDTASRLSTYKSEMLGAGFTEDQTENALNQTWVARNMFVAETESQARELAQEGFARERKHFRQAREIYNPEGFPPLDTTKPLPAGEDFDKTYVIGTASQVADQVAELRDLGVRNLMLKINVGEMDTIEVQKAIRLFGENVMPKFAES